MYVIDMNTIAIGYGVYINIIAGVSKTILIAYLKVRIVIVCDTFKFCKSYMILKFV